MGNEQVAKLPEAYPEDFNPETPITTAGHGSHRLPGVSENTGAVKLLEPPILSPLRAGKGQDKFSSQLRTRPRAALATAPDKLYHS